MVHILNGDSLLEQFPATIDGQKIVCRECLVDGAHFSLELQTLFNQRAAYLTTQYPEHPEIDYTAYTKAQFDKILQLPEGSEVTLWFEDDVFCQVNFWFCTYLLAVYGKNHRLFLTRPPEHTPYGFGGLTEEQLITAYKHRREIAKPMAIANLWEAYCQRDMPALLDKALALNEPDRFIYKAAHAYVQSLPSKDDPGRPIRTLKAIKEELQTHEFGPIFKAFCEREAIYGYGDLQVKKLLKSLE